MWHGTKIPLATMSALVKIEKTVEKEKEGARKCSFFFLIYCLHNLTKTELYDKIYYTS